MKTIKVSYSILDKWAKGKTDDAIQMYLGKLDIGDIPAVKLGREKHEEWEKEIRITKKTPAVFGARQLNEPKPEIYLRKQLNDWLILSGRLDLLDTLMFDGKPTVTGFDWKTGSSAANAFNNSWQHKCYKILFPNMERFEYHAWNPHTGEITMSILHLNACDLNDAVDWVVGQASDMKHQLERMGIVA